MEKKYSLGEVSQIQIQESAENIIDQIKGVEKNIAILQDKVIRLKGVLLKLAPHQIDDKVKITDEWGNVKDNMRITDIGLNTDYSFSYELYPFGEVFGGNKHKYRVTASKRDTITKL
jgi:hypothetical protein